MDPTQNEAMEDPNTDDDVICLDIAHGENTQRLRRSPSVEIICEIKGSYDEYSVAAVDMMKKWGWVNGKPLGVRGAGILNPITPDETRTKQKYKGLMTSEEETTVRHGRPSYRFTGDRGKRRHFRFIRFKKSSNEI